MRAVQVSECADLPSGESVEQGCQHSSEDSRDLDEGKGGAPEIQ